MQRKRVLAPKRERIKLIAKEILYNSLAQALFKIHQTPHGVIKLFWCACLLGAVAGCVYFIIINVLYFFTFDVSSQSKTVYATSATFPKVTICNKNPYTTKFAHENLDKLFESQLELNDSVKQKLGHPLQDFLLFCQFNKLNCSASDFAWSFHRTLGNCFTFNMGVNSTGHSLKLKESTRAGVDLGLKLVLYVNFYEHLSNSYLGAYIKIGNSSTMDLKDGISVGSGFETNIAVDRIYKYSMPKPYSSCEIGDLNTYTTDSVFYNLIKESSYEYEQQLCFELCYHYELFGQLNCTSPFNISFLHAITCPTGEKKYAKVGLSHFFFVKTQLF